MLIDSPRKLLPRYESTIFFGFNYKSRPLEGGTIISLNPENQPK